MRPLSVAATLRGSPYAFGVAIVAATAACGPRAGTLEAASAAHGAAAVQSIEYSGTGRWFV
jgi:hypothetical protein